MGINLRNNIIDQDNFIVYFNFNDFDVIVVFVFVFNNIFFFVCKFGVDDIIYLGRNVLKFICNFILFNF